MDILVYGAGAIGQFVGGKLALGGARVHLIARPAVIEAIAREGLRVTDLGRAEERVRSVTAGVALIDMQPELVLLTVKGAGTDAAARDLAAHVPPATPVLSLQNGVDNLARIQLAAPRLVALAGMVFYNVVQPEPARVRRTTDGLLMAQRAPVTEKLADVCSAAGLALQLRDDMREVQWGKLLVNLNNPINALSGLPLREQLLDAGFRGLLADLQQEALGVLQHARIRPARVAPVAPRWLPVALRLPTPVFRIFASRMLRIGADARSSMQDDRRAGRVTEIADLAGAVVRLAQQVGCVAPLNAAICRVMASAPAERIFSAAELRAALGVK